MEIGERVVKNNHCKSTPSTVYLASTYQKVGTPISLQVDISQQIYFYIVFCTMKKNINQFPQNTLDEASCPVRKAMEIVGGKWRLFIIQQLGKKTLRYGDIKRAIPDISEKMLIQELKCLVEMDVIEKKSFGEIPPRVEYKLTDKGKLALPLLKHITKFGQKLQMYQ